jgi:hypothetical protein
MSSTTSRGVRAASSPVAGDARMPAVRSAAAPPTAARIVPLRRPVDPLLPETPDDDPGPQAA